MNNNTSISFLVDNNTLSWNAVKDMGVSSPEGMILVNVNKIYWKFSDVIQKQEENKCKILGNVLSQITNEKLRYIPMTVGDVVTCFEENADSLPEYTFVSTEAL